MKKLLKLFLALNSVTVLPFTVVACKQESLNDILNIIYKGEIKYSIKDFFPNKEIGSLKEKYILTIDESKQLAQNIANTILDKTNSKSINWYNENPEINQEYYHFDIKNGEKTENNITWEINQVNGRFKIEISYQVGTANSEKKFIARQNINMTFYIKCVTSESDNILDNWVNQFNNKKWNINNPIIVDLTKNKISLPKNNTSWADLDKEIIKATYNTISNEVKNWPTVAYSIVNFDKTITEDMKLNLVLSVNLNDAKKDTNDFFVLYK